MTKNEYELAKAEVIKNLGQPVRGNGFETADNESAKALNSLKGKYLSDIRADKKHTQQNKLEETIQAIPDDKKKEYKRVALPEIIILDKDLKQFEAIEKEILKDHFSNLDLEPKYLANKYGKSYQFVAGLLKSKDVQYLRTKYFTEILNVETMKSVLRAVKAGDSRTIESASEYLKLMSNTEDNTGSKPIDDKQAEEQLRQLGDKLAGE